MTMKVLPLPEGAAGPAAPLSLGVESNGFVFVSGAVAFRPGTAEIVGDTVEEQTRQAIENVKAVLATRGLTLADVVQARAYLVEPQRDFDAFNAVYAEMFPKPFPARTTIGVSLAKKGLLVEIDVMATV